MEMDQIFSKTLNERIYFLWISNLQRDRVFHLRDGFDEYFQSQFYFKILKPVCEVKNFLLNVFIFHPGAGNYNNNLGTRKLMNIYRLAGWLVILTSQVGVSPCLPCPRVSPHLWYLQCPGFAIYHWLRLVAGGIFQSKHTQHQPTHLTRSITLIIR